MTRGEAISYLKEHNEALVSVAKDENVYDYEKQVIEADCMRISFEANEMAIKALEQEHIFDKIIEDIQTLRGCSCWCSDGIIDDVEDIIDKYRAESEVKE